jgi:hypothetical protein
MRRIKPHLLLVSILLMPFLIQVAFVKAAPETVVKVEPYSSYANLGETFTINITVADVQNLYGVEVTLYWNASILYVISVDLRLGVESHPDGVLHESPSPPYFFIAENDVTQEQGKYRLAATSMAPAPPFNGAGNIVRITFTATNHGNCTLNLETELWDYPPPNQGSMPIEHITIDGFFDVIPEFPNILILPLFIILTIFVVVFCKKISRKLDSRLFDSQLSKQNLLV